MMPLTTGHKVGIGAGLGALAVFAGVVYALTREGYKELVVTFLYEGQNITVDEAVIKLYPETFWYFVNTDKVTRKIHETGKVEARASVHNYPGVGRLIGSKEAFVEDLDNKTLPIEVMMISG